MAVFGNELASIAFLAALWFMEKVVLRLGGSPVVANLLTGILLGPALADIVPYSEAWKLIGKLGVLLLIVDGTLSIDLETVKRVAVRSFFAALFGVIGPVGLCMLVTTQLYDRSWKTALATGAAIAPTSLGFSAKLLQESKQMTTDLGQLICVAAVMDDVLSLCLLAELQVVKDTGGDDANATVTNASDTRAGPSSWDYARPAVASLGSILVGTVLALFIMPRVIPRLLRVLPLKGKERSYFLVFVIFAMSTGLAYASASAGSSDLLGCFCGALPFSAFREFTDAWGGSGVASLCTWGGRAFFAGTIGFGVPKVRTGAGGMLDGRAVVYGLLLGMCGIFGKLFLAVFASPLNPVNAMVFGMAMQGRGEFSFILADEAATDGLFEAGTADHPAVVWGLLICCVSAPFLFRYVLSLISPPAEPAGPRMPRHCIVPPLETKPDHPAVATAPQDTPEAAAESAVSMMNGKSFAVAVDKEGEAQFYDI